MDLILIVAIAITPGCIGLWLFFIKNQVVREQRIAFAKMFLWGICLVIPVAIAQLPFLLLEGDLLLFIIIAPIIEEYAKYWLVRRSLPHQPCFHQPQDSIIYAVTAALGFASIENSLYLLVTYINSKDTMTAWEIFYPGSELFSIFVVRTLLSMPGHLLWASLSGYALGIAHNFAIPNPRKTVAIGLGLAIASHGLFNAFIIFLPGAAAIQLLLIILGWQIVTRRSHSAIAAPVPNQRTVEAIEE